MNLEHKRKLREIELNRALPFIQQGSKILEIGAGAGWQAIVFSDKGFDIEAIDVQESGYAKTAVFRVQFYDGKTIPYPDQHFDVVFSSNGLQHIPHMKVFQAEIKRVLKPGGIAVHIMPSVSWRFWTALSYYPNMFKKLGKLFQSNNNKPAEVDERSSQVLAHKLKNRSVPIRLFRAMYPKRLGEHGNVFSELFLFSKTGWKGFFENTDWKLDHCKNSQLFYTGYQLLGKRLGLKTRKVLSNILGSSCSIFVLSKHQKVN